jgi:AraC family transcriptional regulator
MPNPQRGIQEYAKRMNAVVNHIDLHLAEALDLDKLSRIAHFSPYHFHRLFAAWMGETLGEYLRRRRLEQAAIMLAGQSRLAVLDVALAVGFASGEAFARAFKAHFGCAPRDWQSGHDARWRNYLQLRQKLFAQVSNPDQVRPGEFSDHVDSFNPETEFKMDVTIQHLPATKIAFLRKVGPYGPAIAEFWQQTFVPWIKENQLQYQPIFGIGHDDPSITPPEKCRYDAAVAVPDDFVATGQAMTATLPGGKYAVCHFKGGVQDIGPAWMKMFRVWLPESGMQYDTRPCFEAYPAWIDDKSSGGIFECDICISVKPL